MTDLNEQRLRRSLEEAAGEVAGTGDPGDTWRRASHRVTQRRRRRRAASAAAAIVVVGLAAAATVPQIVDQGVSDQPGVAEVNGEPDPRSGDEQTESAPEPERAPEPDSDGDVEMATTTCADTEHGVAVDYPADWHTTESGCGMFGPEPLDIEEETGGSGGFEGVRISREVAPYSFDAYVDELDGPAGKELVEVDERTVNGRRAVRVEAIASGEIGQPEGTRSVRWAIELDGKRVLVLHADDASDPESFERDVEVLDAMATSVRSLDGEQPAR